MVRASAMAACAALSALGLPAASATDADGPAAPAEITTELPSARLLGSGRLTFFRLPVYEARLWVSSGFTAANSAQVPLALELQYARAVGGKLIAERSLSEMKKLGEVTDEQSTRWLAEMTRLFPDIAQGERLTGVHRPGESARFFFNGRLRGEVRDADFARLFFSVWLSPRTSEPQLRQALLGSTKAAP